MSLARRFHMLMLSQFKFLAGVFRPGASLVCRQSGHVG